MTQSFSISDADDDIRVDRWFRRYYPGLTQGALQKAIRKGLIRVDGKKAKADDRLLGGQELLVKFLELDEFRESGSKSKAVKKEARQLADYQIKETQSWVLFKDDRVIAINKPAGLAVQGGSGLNDHIDGRLVALQFEKDGVPKLVHRLDKDTSGVLLLARSAKDATTLTKAFASKEIEKTYLALVVGVPEVREGEIEGAMQKSGEGYEKVVLDEDGKKAVTHYRVLENLGGRLSLVELQPITGRTHQLRVHMAEMGHPIVGDGKYGGKKAFVDGMEMSRQLHLHAHHIVMPNWKLDVTAPLPKHMQKTLKMLGIDDV